MKQYTLGEFTLDDFADFLAGKPNPQFEGIEGNELLISGEHKLSKTIEINVPMTLTGGNAVIFGNNTDTFSIEVSSSDVVVQGLTFKDTKLGVAVDAKGSLVENVLVKDITMHGGITAVDVGSSISDSTLREIHIEGCNSICANEIFDEYELAPTSMFIYISSAKYKGGAHINNTLLENVYVDGCKKSGHTRAGLVIAPAMPAGTNYVFQDLGYSNATIRGVYVTNCHIDECWDTAVGVNGSFIQTGAVKIENMVFENNYFGFGITGIVATGGTLMGGEYSGSMFDGITIKNNHFVSNLPCVGVASRSISIIASRGDYYPGVAGRDFLIKNIEIAHNKFEGAGISLTGAHQFVDGDAVHTNNVVDGANIHHNELFNVECAFMFNGAEGDCRMFDWNTGYPRGNRRWAEEVEDPTVPMVIMKDNKLKNITCTDNTVEGYRYKVFATGATGRGHGLCTGNKVTDGIVFERNTFSEGECHLWVLDTLLMDYLEDGGDNEVSKVFKEL